VALRDALLFQIVGGIIDGIRDSTPAKPPPEELVKALHEYHAIWLLVPVAGYFILRSVTSATMYFMGIRSQMTRDIRKAQLTRSRIGQIVYRMDLTLRVTSMVTEAPFGLCIMVGLALIVGDLLLEIATEPFFIPAFAICAILLFVLRQKALDLYAILEIVVGLAAISGSILSNKAADISHFIGVLGGVYIVVRGLDNFERALPVFRAKLSPRRAELFVDFWEIVFKWNSKSGENDAHVPHSRWERRRVSYWAMCHSSDLERN
jgi:hypothetical protein